MYLDLVYVLDEAYTTMSPDRSQVLSFDREGRMIGMFRRGLTYRRGADSRVMVRWRDNSRQRRWLSAQETYALYRDVYETAALIARQAKDELKKRLQNEILPWTPHALLSEGRRFHSVYQPVPILPPDQYRSIVLQVTEGCTWNRCTFCNFYAGRRFKLRSYSQYAKHVKAVHQLFGKGLRLRRGVFLGDGNALALSPERLEQYIDITRTVFPEEPLYGFVDVFSGEGHSVDDWARLRSLGLHRVYLGMETGHDPLLELLNKPGSQEETVQVITDMKAAGLNVSPIVMVGIGGHRYRARHAADTLAAMKRMPLGQGDIVYLSPFIEHGDSIYSQMRREAGITAMTEQEVERELAYLSEQIRAMDLKTSRYDIRDAMY